MEFKRRLNCIRTKNLPVVAVLLPLVVDAAVAAGCLLRLWFELSALKLLRPAAV